MRLYHYAPKVNTIKEKGLLSISKGPRDLRAYAHRAGSENRELGLIKLLPVVRAPFKT